MMIPFEEALKLVLDNSGEPEVEEASIDAAVGHVLASDVYSDIDMPPFNRSAMDGFAISGNELRHELLEEIVAGDAREIRVKPGLGCPIMTGAPVPEGADRIVIVEETVVEDSVLYLKKVPSEGANICWKGEDIKKGHIVLEHGTRLSHQHMGIAAMAGRSVLPVFRKPRIAVVTTGTEIVPPTWIPSPGQVRNANMPLITSQLSMNGFPTAVSVHSADDPNSLRATFSQFLNFSDVLVVAGGVSRGTRDFVPSVFESLGARIHFRMVAQKPGKPLTFGSSATGKPVFGLPGNPVSVMVTIEEYVLPLLRKRSGFKGYHKRVYHGEITSDYKKKPGRLHFLRVIAYREGSAWKLHHPDSSGSGDLMSTVNVNALAIVSENQLSIQSGETLPFHFFSSTAGELAFS
ncbi:MAG: molybdopterin molybdotransferase MoeA [Candidatus Aegiribacteria sp.]|nr:molybdopterin molybdotransferase MoeA [Candidatus Aegiribacteria sp.]